MSVRFAGPDEASAEPPSRAELPSCHELAAKTESAEREARICDGNRERYTAVREPAKT
jgi:hypothetical protein